MTAKEIIDHWVGNHYEKGDSLFVFVDYLDDHYTITEKIK